MTDTVTIPKWSLGDRLRKAREFAGVAAEDMAEDIGRTPRTIRNYENGSTHAPLLVIRQYASRTGVPVEWLTGGYSATDGTASDGEPHDRWSFAVAA